MMRTQQRVMFAVGLACLGGCAGYNLQLGTSASTSRSAGFFEVYQVPATSLSPWTERNSPLALPAPGQDGASGASTLPASRDALPPEHPAPPVSNTSSVVPK
jgi:hypothetical protein